MEKVFFSKENFNIIYNILADKIQKQQGFDIKSDQKFHKELINIIKAVYQQRNTFNLPSNMSHLDASRYRSQKSINVAMNYFSDTIKKINNKTNIDHLQRDINSIAQQQVNKIDNRPLSTTVQQPLNTNGSSSVMSNFNRLVSERDQQPAQFPKPINFKEPNNISNNDVQNKYDMLQQSRQTEYDNITNSSSNPNNSAMPTKTSDIQNGVNHPSMNNISNSNQNNGMLTQQNYMNNPQNDQVQMLLRQQQELQNQINNIQRNSNVDQGPGNINLDSSGQFNPPTQKNTQFLAEDSKPLNNILENQFTSLVEDENDSERPRLEIKENDDMSPDNIDYSQVLAEMNQTDGISNQFNTQLQNLQQTDKSDQQVTELYPKQLIDNSVTERDPSGVSNNAVPDHELQVIKSSLELQSNNLTNANNKIDSMIKIMETNDISKFYTTIMDIPRVIKEQKEKPLTLRTHNLIVSSRDRDLSNDEFDKYKFRIVFGAEGTQTQTLQVEDRPDVTTNANGVKQQTFTSTGLRNPTVQQVLKNVVSIKLKRVIIPKPRDEFYVPEPYFFLSVDEFGSNIISTKTFADKIFCKIHFDKEFGFSNGRKYLYYKNDDDDFTMFYSSPLAKLDRLTLKLLDSDGDNAKSSFNDSDITKVTSYNDPNSVISKEFYANTFERDRIFNLNENQKTKVKTTNHDDGGNNDPSDDVYTIQTDLVSQNEHKLVNLSNQLEYIFEIKTQELDPTAEIRPALN